MKKINKTINILKNSTSLLGLPSVMKIITVKLPDALVQGMDELVRAGMYPSRSAIVRAAVRDLLKNELWQQQNQR